ncbi:DUF397 domain-containing protein [Yinghuangia sp. YIM S09857]|uniref:DUF397 domain-containing protein n=1 Tax=Yinghuangia sp. YIM S09857 TaxID=3436929 RepID=UPI003F5391B8
MSNRRQAGTARAFAWRKSSYSGGNGGECVEVAVGEPGLLVRDSKVPGLGRLAVTSRSWSALTSSLSVSNSV